MFLKWRIMSEVAIQFDLYVMVKWSVRPVVDSCFYLVETTSFAKLY